MSIEPLFMIGTGRSGSSIAAHILSHHPALSYLTPAAHDHPDFAYLNRWALHCLRIPGARRIVGRRLGLSEAYNFWEKHSQGFSNPARDLTGDDVTVRKAESLRSAVAEMMISGRPRFFAKLTGWGRVGFLKKVFPDARFIHLVRDGRDVANSFLHVPFWDGWGGPEKWRYGELSETDRRVWVEHDRSFVILAGLAWKVLVRSVERARSSIPEAPIHEVRYEDFVQRPVRVLEDIVEFSSLTWSAALDRCIDNNPLHDQSGRHENDLYDHQIRALTEVLRDPLERYGYL